MAFSGGQLAEHSAEDGERLTGSRADRPVDAAGLVGRDNGVRPLDADFDHAAHIVAAALAAYARQMNLDAGNFVGEPRQADPLLSLPRLRAVARDPQLRCPY